MASELWKYAAAFTVLAFASVSFPVAGQSFEELRQKAYSGIQRQGEKARSDFEVVQSRADAAFAEVLARSWRGASGGTCIKNSLQSIPDRRPVQAVPGRKTADVSLKVNSIAVAGSAPGQKSLKIPENGSYAGSVERIRFNFYGRALSVPAPEGLLLTLKGRAGESQVAEAWKELSSGRYDAMLSGLGSIYRSLHLCDWAWLKLTEAASAAVFGQAESNEAVVMQAWLLSNSGIKVRLCRGADGKLRKLLSADMTVFDVPYYYIDGEQYFIESGASGDIYVQEGAFPGTRSLHLPLDTLPFAEGTSLLRKTFNGAGVAATVATDTGVKAFYEDYPAFSKEGSPESSFVFIARTPLSNAARRSLYAPLSERLAGKTDIEKVGVLLDFVQHAFPYKEDESVWGRERYFYPEETLSYPYSDCEDRAILFARLVHDLAGLDAALVCFPGHLAAAVDFGREVPGVKFISGSRTFVLCDPTYIGAGPGELMPGLNPSETILLEL